METAEFPHERASPLLDLPSEIRNRICELVLVQKGPVKIVDGWSPSGLWALLVTCRQIREEASGFFYNGNIFGHHSGDYQATPDNSSVASLASWLKKIGPRNRAVLREIHVWPTKNKDMTLEEKRMFLETHCAVLARYGMWLDPSIVRIRVEAQHLSLPDLIVLTEPEEKIENGYATGPEDFKGPHIRRWGRASPSFLDKEERGKDERESTWLLCSKCDCPVPSDITAHRGVMEIDDFDDKLEESQSLHGGDVLDLVDVSDIFHQLFGSDGGHVSEDESLENNASGELKDSSETGDVLDDFDFAAFVNDSLWYSGLENDADFDW